MTTATLHQSLWYVAGEHTAMSTVCGTTGWCSYLIVVSHRDPQAESCRHH